MKFLVDEWKSFWKHISFYAFVLIGAAPDIYQGIAALGWLQDENVPPAFVWTVRGLAVAGIVGRYVRQKAKEKPLPAPQGEK